MIRNFHTPDLDPVLNIWLLASTQAHHFIPSTFWHEQLDAMRDIYLPSATTRVFEADGAVAGFCSVYGDTLAALFVEPARQGGGIGRQLLADAMLARSTLQLTVYSANAPAIRFYEAQGFVVLGEQLDEHTGHLEKVMRWVAKVSDDDQLQFLTGIAQRISRQEDVMAQVNNHSVDQVMHGFFPKRVLDTVLDAMTDHEKLSLEVLDNETKSRAFALVILKMLKTAAALENGGVRDA